MTRRRYMTRGVISRNRRINRRWLEKCRLFYPDNSFLWRLEAQSEAPEHHEVNVSGIDLSFPCSTFQVVSCYVQVVSQCRVMRVLYDNTD